AATTLLVILLHEESSVLERLQRRLKRYFERARENRRERLRIRVWDRPYLAQLVQQFPELGYKYFGLFRGADAKARRTTGLVEQNDLLLGKLAISEAELVAERNRRIRLERDAIWK